MLLTDKKILIISATAWGSMLLSKHHYAIQLAKMGNTVYYLLPPPSSEKNNRLKCSFEIKKHPDYEHLYLIQPYLPFYYYYFRFHLSKMYFYLMKKYIDLLLKELNGIDIVWSFDMADSFPLSIWNSKIKIFHPVDEPKSMAALASAKGADIIFSVTREILSKYADYKIPKYFINHGVNAHYINTFLADRVTNQPIRVGYSGNLLRGDIDREILLKIILQNSNVIFEFWGPYNIKDSNISGNDDLTTKSFINDLKKSPNVILHGTVKQDELSVNLNRMDAFLISYDVIKDHCGGTNYHKVIEYISTGKVIISNNITTYQDRRDLIQMVEERTHNDKLPTLFEKVINNLNYYNSTELQTQRIAFAHDNTYQKQIDRIEKYLSLLQ